MDIPLRGRNIDSELLFDRRVFHRGKRHLVSTRFLEGKLTVRIACACGFRREADRLRSARGQNCRSDGDRRADDGILPVGKPRYLQRFGCGDFLRAVRAGFSFVVQAGDLDGFDRDCLVGDRNADLAGGEAALGNRDVDDDVRLIVQPILHVAVVHLQFMDGVCQAVETRCDYAGIVPFSCIDLGVVPSILAVALHEGQAAERIFCCALGGLGDVLHAVGEAAPAGTHALVRQRDFHVEVLIIGSRVVQIIEV